MLEPVSLDDVALGLAHAALPQAMADRLLGVAGGLNRIFLIRPPAAPGACFFGAEGGPDGRLWTSPPHPRVSLSGMGFSPAEALVKCLGEAVELISQFETGTEAVERRTCGLVAVGDFLTGDTAGVCIAGRRLRDGASCRLPLGLCVRPATPGAYGRPAFPLGLGGGAGATAEDAALHGLLELIERDAAALWWRGGRAGRLISAGDEAALAIAPLLLAARQGVIPRPVTLIEISREFGVPVVAALSTGLAGRGFACGLAARPTLDQAIRSAVLEMLQMELAQDLAEAKQARGGQAGLNAIDRAHLAKRSGPSASALGAVKRATVSAVDGGAPLIADRSAAEAVRTLATRLAARQIETFSVDLTRPRFLIPAVRIIAPALQPEPSAVVTPRLEAWPVTPESRPDGPLLG
ncbi:YcaO-like family protein [Phreatobacter stygius]|uniref:YcaO-like family protein n=1 Tax=Phreatobacter stygius TaxID=1940610 RepID=UPI0014770453|nr:YcaO-like family protein [Phreatobacter stygius]